MTLFAADACSRLDDDVNFVLARSNENRRVRGEGGGCWLAGWLHSSLKSKKVQYGAVALGIPYSPQDTKINVFRHVSE